MKTASINFLRSRFPGLYEVLKRLIKTTGSLFSKAQPWPNGIEIYGKDFDHSYFGYYDVLPKNEQGLVLIHAIEDGRTLIAVFDEDQTIATVPTNGYNFQQGNRSLWIDSNRFVFNDLDEDHAACGFIYNIQTQEKTCLPDPILNLFDPHSFWTANFGLVAEHNSDYALEETKPKGGECYFRLVSLADHSVLRDVNEDRLRSEIPVDLDDMFVNHAFVSPQKSQVLFFVRGVDQRKVHHNLMLYSPQMDELTHLHGGRYISHPGWIDETRIVIHMEYNGRTGYHEIDLQRKTTELTNVFPFSSDGHPTIRNGYAVTDTYPNSRGYQKLFVEHLPSGESSTSMFFHSSRFSGKSRCDLHPRVDEQGRVYIDTVNGGSRRAVVFEPLKAHNLN